MFLRKNYVVYFDVFHTKYNFQGHNVLLIYTMDQYVFKPHDLSWGDVITLWKKRITGYPNNSPNRLLQLI